MWILMKQEMIGWQWHQLDRMKSFAPRYRQTTTPAPHHLDDKCFNELQKHVID